MLVALADTLREKDNLKDDDWVLELETEVEAERDGGHPTDWVG